MSAPATCKASTGLHIKIPTIDSKTVSTNFRELLNWWSDEENTIELVGNSNHERWGTRGLPKP